MPDYGEARGGEASQTGDGPLESGRRTCKEYRETTGGLRQRIIDAEGIEGTRMVAAAKWKSAREGVNLMEALPAQ